MNRLLKIAVYGSTGRMGRIVCDKLLNDVGVQENFCLVQSCSGSHDPRFKELLVSHPDVVIDFSAPGASLELAKECGVYKIPALICTTGFSQRQLKTMERLLKGTPWALIPNTSLGVWAMGKALEILSRLLLNESFDTEITEVHHKAKKDMPSGTANRLKEQMLSVTNKKDIPVHSVRAGTEVGEHTVVFWGEAERIELNHRAGDRSLFALGALRLAKKLSRKKAKKSGQAYSVDDLF